MSKEKLKKEVSLSNLEGFLIGSDTELENMIPTGHSQLDFVLSGGLVNDKIKNPGLPLGKLVMAYGDEGCLDGDTNIMYFVTSDNNNIIDKKSGGSIKGLYKIFNGSYSKYKKSTFYASCMNENGEIFQNKIIGVVKTGTKECFSIETNLGYKLTSTKDHKFWNGSEFIELGNLSVNDSVYIHNNTKTHKEVSPNKKDKENYIYVNSHGVVLKNKNSKHKLLKSRAIIEADINGMPYDSYIQKLDSSDIKDLKFLNNEDYVYHLDENYENKSLCNLTIIKPNSSNSVASRNKNLKYKVIEDKIKSITPVGQKETYDIQMQCPFNNFIANNFVVHNSGKSSLAYRVVGNAQKMGYKCAWIDSEQSFSEDLAKINGADPSKIYYNNLVDTKDPEKVCSAERVMDLIISACKSGHVKVIVVDSIASLTPGRVLENTVEESEGISELARVLSRSLPKIAQYAAANGVLIIMINQLREKIGVMFGDNKTMNGGKTLKHMCSIILQIMKLASKKNDIVVENENGEEVVVGRYSNVLVEKNRFGKPHRDTIKVPIYYENYFPDIDEVVFNFGRSVKLIKARVNNFSWGDIKVEGKEAFKNELKKSNNLEKIIKELKSVAEEEKLILPLEISKYSPENNEKLEKKKQKDKNLVQKSQELDEILSPTLNISEDTSTEK